MSDSLITQRERMDTWNKELGCLNKCFSISVFFPKSQGHLSMIRNPDTNKPTSALADEAMHNSGRCTKNRRKKTE